MAYVNVAEWSPEQVVEWIKGLDNVVLPYIHSFLNNEVDGKQLLNLRPDDLDHLGVHKLGHQELILEAVDHLRNFHYELDRENVQLLALRLSCQARSLYNELRHASTSEPVSTQALSDVAGIIKAVKPLVCWLDRTPFSDHGQYQERKSKLLKLSLELATCAQRDRFAERPVEEIRNNSRELADLADGIIQDVDDPLILQPASLELATIKKKAGDDLGFYLMPSFHGIHQITEIKLQSAAHQCGKIVEGDGIVQVNYQTVVGWQGKKVMHLLAESPTEIFLTLKKHPRHISVYGQIYIKPYRLPSKKRAPYFRWHGNLPSPRPELLTLPNFEIPPSRTEPDEVVQSDGPLDVASDTDDDAFLPDGEDDVAASPTSMRIYSPKPRVTVQRRATVTGASPTSSRPPVDFEQFWREIKKEREIRGLQMPEGAVEPKSSTDSEEYQLREKSASFDIPTRPTTCLGSDASMEARGGINVASRKWPAMEAKGSDNSEGEGKKEKKAAGNKEMLQHVQEESEDQHKTSSEDVSESKVLSGHSGQLDKSKSFPMYGGSSSDCESKDQRLRTSNEYYSPSSNHDFLTKDQRLRNNTNHSPTDQGAVSKQTKHISQQKTTDNLHHTIEVKSVHEVAKNTSGEPVNSNSDKKQQSSAKPAFAPPPRILVESCEGPDETSAEGVYGQNYASAVTVCEQPKTEKSGYKSFVARSMSRNKGNTTSSSPKLLKRKNPLLAKRRKVSCKELGTGDCQGWLLRRNRDNISGAHWSRMWFVLKGVMFYGFKDREAPKADCFISLPGFTVSFATEVKSRKCAFKIYHTGTVFYFAAESEEELAAWMNSLAQATVGFDTYTHGDSSEAICFSETDEESSEGVSNPSTMNGKGSSSRTLKTNEHVEHKGYDVQKKFSSLKKLRSSKKPENSRDEGASLDRKYLRFLSGNKNNMPVPTAQYRSYRRVDPCVRLPGHKVIPPECMPDRETLYGSTKNCDGGSDRILPNPSQSFEQSDYRADRSQNVPKVKERNRKIPQRALLASKNIVECGDEKSKLRNVYASATNSPDPSDHDYSDFLYGEKMKSLSTSRLTMHRRGSLDSGCSDPPSRRGSSSGLPSPTNIQLTKRNNTSSNISSITMVTTRRTAAAPSWSEYRGGSPEKFWINSLRRGEEKEKKQGQKSSIAEGCIRLKNAALYQPPLQNKSKDESRMRLAFEMHLDQSQQVSPESKSENCGKSKFRLFSPRLTRKLGMSKSSDSVPSKNKKSDLLDDKIAEPPKSPKTLLGSPRLHRALFRDKKKDSRKLSLGSLRDELEDQNTLGVDRYDTASITSQSSASLASERCTRPPGSLNVPPSHSDSSPDSVRMQLKPTMGVSMIGKQRRLPPPPFSYSPPGSPLYRSPASPRSPLLLHSPTTLAVDNIYTPNPTNPAAPANSEFTFSVDEGIPAPTGNPPPDYPGLEYPPVFEPGTYSLPEACALRARRRVSGIPYSSSSSSGNSITSPSSGSSCNQNPYVVTPSMNTSYQSSGTNSMSFFHKQSSAWSSNAWDRSPHQPSLASSQPDPNQSPEGASRTYQTASTQTDTSES